MSTDLDNDTTQFMDVNDDNKQERRNCMYMYIFRTRPLLCITIYFALAYFVQGIVDIASGFVNLPLRTILKENLHLTPSQMGTFFFTCTITWSIKPIYGLLTDFLPICGYHRFLYLLCTTAINLLAWLALYLAPIQYDYLLVFCVLAAFSLAFNDVLIDALMISIGRPLGLINTFQGIQQVSTKFASAISQIPAGIFAHYSYSTLSSPSYINSLTTTIKPMNVNKSIFLISAVCPTILFFTTLIMVRERQRKLNKENFQQTWSNLSTVFHHRSLWLIVAFLFISSASPQPATSLFYYQRDILKFSPFYISILTTIYNGCGALSAILYLSMFSHYSIQKILRITIIMRILSMMSLLYADDYRTSIFVAIFTGLCSQIITLAMINLAAQTCPKHIEGTLFALFMSCTNFGWAVGDWLGAYIYEQMGFVSMIFIAIFWIAMTLFGTYHITEHNIKLIAESN